MLSVFGLSLALLSTPPPATTNEADCVLYPSVSQSIRVAVQPSVDRIDKRTRAIVLAINPGWEEAVAKYHFAVEASDRPPVDVPIEGPFPRELIEKRFGTFWVPGYATYWVLPVPAPDEQVDVTVTATHGEPGFNPRTNGACTLILHASLVKIGAKHSTQNRLR